MYPATCCTRCSHIPDVVMDEVATILMQCQSEALVEALGRTRARLQVVEPPTRVEGLSPWEWRILRELLLRRPQVVTREELFATANLGERLPYRSRAIDVHMRRLRLKVEPMGYRIETVRGFGYRLTASPEESAA